MTSRWVGFGFLVWIISLMAHNSLASELGIFRADEEQDAWQKVADGISDQKSPFRRLRVTDTDSSLYGVELCTYEVENGSASLYVKDVQQKGALVPIYAEHIPSQASAAFTGGFFGYANDGSFAPLGLVISNSKTINKLHPWSSGGIVQFRDHKVEIIPVREYGAHSDITTAIQSKPLLVEAGKDGIRSSSDARFDRVAIATTTDNRVMVVMINTPTGKGATLGQFSSLLLNIKTTTGGKVSWALALDGGPGAHLRYGDVHCGRGEPNYVPNLLYLQP